MERKQSTNQMKRDNTMTRRFLADAGIVPGMRVLEIGCGNGEVTQELAELVGPNGSIVALDRNEGRLAMARERMQEQGIAHVHFATADVTGGLSELAALQGEPFDALVGRRVLMYLPDPAAVLGRLSERLRSGGLVVFEEADATMVPARISPLPAHDQVAAWLRSMLIAEGANPAMGFALPAMLVQAGLRFERIRAEAVILSQGTQFSYSVLLKLMQSRLIAAGIATQAEVDALMDQLDVEASDPTHVYVGAMSFCAWAYKY
ncbi:MAG: methyltransferase domain-containing protein [Caldilineaceae bacterium]